MKTFAAIICTMAVSGLFAATWPLTETSGQELANTGAEQGLSGYLGTASKPDELDAKMTGEEGISCDGKTTATIPSSPFFSFANAKGFTLSIEVKPLEELDEATPGSRYQILTKGSDSAPGNWQLRIGHGNAYDPFRLEFFMLPPGPDKKGLFFPVEVPIIAQEWMKITVTMDRKNCKIYVDGEEVGSFPCKMLPPFSTAPLKFATYSYDSLFGFPAQFRNLVIERKAIPPTPAQ